MQIQAEITTGSRPHRLPNGSVIHRYSHVLKGAVIGHSVMIGEHCYVASDVTIGNYSRIQNSNNLYDGLELGEYVFIGPNVTLTNHHDPSIKDRGEFKPDSIWIKDRGVICAGSTIVAPRIVHEGGFVAAGAVVLRDINKNERYYSLYKDKYES